MSRAVAIMMALMVCGVTTAATINVAADSSGDYTTILAATFYAALLSGILAGCLVALFLLIIVLTISRRVKLKREAIELCSMIRDGTLPKDLDELHKFQIKAFLLAVGIGNKNAFHTLANYGKDASFIDLLIARITSESCPESKKLQLVDLALNKLRCSDSLSTPLNVRLTPLHVACRWNSNPEFASALIRNGACPNATASVQICIPIHDPASWTENPIFEYYRTQGVGFLPIYTLTSIDLTILNRSHLTPEDRLEIVDLLIESGCNIDKQGTLVLALGRQQYAIAKRLIELYCTPGNAAPISLGLILLLAISHNLISSTRTLLARGVDPHASFVNSGISCLMACAILGIYNESTRLVMEHVDFDKRCNKGRSLMMYAAMSTHCNDKLIDALISFGVNVNSRCSAEWTALMYAAKESNQSSHLAKLLDAGALVHPRTRLGQTASALAKKNQTFFSTPIYWRLRDETLNVVPAVEIKSRDRAIEEPWQD
jgi:ankyrin repeat protein